MMQTFEFPFMTTSLLVLFLGGLLIYVFKGRLEKSAGKVAVAFSFASVVLMAPPFFKIFTTGEVSLESAEWSSILGSFGLFLDPIAFPITFAIVVLGFLSVVYAVGYTDHEKNTPTFFANQLFFLMGMIGVTLATNLIEFFIFWEIMLVPSYFLILLWGLPETRKRTAMKFWLYTQSGALCILVAIGLLYAFTGSFVLEIIQMNMATLALASNIGKIIFILLAAGFLVKMAVFPIHWWLPPVHAEAPTPISVLLSGAMIETGAYALIRYGTFLLGDAAQALSFGVMALGVVTMFYGGFMAIAQVDIKRLLAYSSVSQMGYVLFALGSMTTLGVAGGMFHLVNHAFSKGLLFMCAGTVIHQTKIRDIRLMGGLSNKMPITAFAAAIGALSIAASPPLSGFASEWMMFAGGFQSALITAAGVGRPEFLILSVIAVSSSIVSGAYMLRFLWKVFLGPHPDGLEDVNEGPRSMVIPQIILGVLIVVLGVFPGLIVDVIWPALQHITNMIVTPIFP